MAMIEDTQKFYVPNFHPDLLRYHKQGRDACFHSELYLFCEDKFIAVLMEQKSG